MKNKTCDTDNVEAKNSKTQSRDGIETKSLPKKIQQLEAALKKKKMKHFLLLLIKLNI